MQVLQRVLAEILGPDYTVRLVYESPSDGYFIGIYKDKRMMQINEEFMAGLLASHVKEKFDGEEERKSG